MRRRYDAVVASAGGAGTTTILKFLAPLIAVNEWNSFHDGLKHPNRPSHPIFDNIEVSRALYLVADPREVVLSLFRRDYAKSMPAKIASEHHNVEEYGMFVRSNQHDEYELSTFLEEGVDSFGLHTHWHNWSTGQHDFPILIVNYASLPGSFGAIGDFLSLSREHRDQLPEWHERNSALDLLPQPQQMRLNEIYGDLAREIESFPAVFERSVV